MDCFGTYFTHRYLDLRRYLRRVATFQATFEGSGPLKVPLKVPFEGTFDGSRPSKLPSKGRAFEGTFEGPLWRSLWRYLRRSLWRYLRSSAPLKVEALRPSPGSQQRTFVEGLKGPDLRRYLRRRVLTDYPQACVCVHSPYYICQLSKSTGKIHGKSRWEKQTSSTIAQWTYALLAKWIYCAFSRYSNFELQQEKTLVLSLNALTVTHASNLLNLLHTINSCEVLSQRLGFSCLKLHSLCLFIRQNQCVLLHLCVPPSK